MGVGDDGLVLSDGGLNWPHQFVQPSRHEEDVG